MQRRRGSKNFQVSSYGVLDAGDDFFVAELDTKDGIINIGSMICYDREFPESARVLMLKGGKWLCAELLLYD